METSKRFSKVFHFAGYAAIIAILAGCGHSKPLLRTKSETEIAVSAIKAEWLKLCEAPAGGDPENQVGALLQDYADVAEALAICIKRHNDLVGYLKPVIKKEQAK